MYHKRAGEYADTVDSQKMNDSGEYFRGVEVRYLSGLTAIPAYRCHRTPAGSSASEGSSMRSFAC